MKTFIALVLIALIAFVTVQIEKSVASYKSGSKTELANQKAENLVLD